MSKNESKINSKKRLDNCSNYLRPLSTPDPFFNSHSFITLSDKSTIPDEREGQFVAIETSGLNTSV